MHAELLLLLLLLLVMLLLPGMKLSGGMRPSGINCWSKRLRRLLKGVFASLRSICAACGLKVRCLGPTNFLAGPRGELTQGLSEASARLQTTKLWLKNSKA
jgi:hypothetical protein